MPAYARDGKVVVFRGGHFAAWEEPELFAGDVRAFFRPLRLR
jgi:pimeloyl-ACP methyl ester carboxylesterase